MEKGGGEEVVVRVGGGGTGVKQAVAGQMVPGSAS